jgi:N-methylhydantoinase A/oxoprolinase/acetone carboxylase beta subunit
VSDALSTMTTRFFDRSDLPVDDPVAGPAVIFQPDTTILVPPGWTARVSAEGPLLMTSDNAKGNS